MQYSHSGQMYQRSHCMYELCKHSWLCYCSKIGEPGVPERTHTQLTLFLYFCWSLKKCTVNATSQGITIRKNLRNHITKKQTLSTKSFNFNQSF